MAKEKVKERMNKDKNKFNKLNIISIIDIVSLVVLLFLIFNVNILPTKYLILVLAGENGYGMNSLVFSMITGIIITTSLVTFIILKELNKKS